MTQETNLYHIPSEELKAKGGEELKIGETPQPGSQANKEQFESALEGKKEASPTAQPSLLQAVRDLQGTAGAAALPSQQSLVMQTQEALTTIRQIKKILSSPEVKVKDSAQRLLRDKLEHINESLKATLSRAGVENLREPEATLPIERSNPINRFLGFLTDGEWKLQHLTDDLNATSKKGLMMSPVDMLAIQVKVTQVQQELELFTSLLSKGLESIKTMMNVQV